MKQRINKETSGSGSQLTLGRKYCQDKNNYLQLLQNYNLVQENGTAKIIST